MKKVEWGKPYYGIVDSGVFGLRIISGILTGIRYTETSPVYELSFQRDKWWSSQITDKKEELMDMMKIGTLDRVKETHGLSIKYS